MTYQFPEVLKGRCPSGKHRYKDAQAAQGALDTLEARIAAGTIEDMCFAKRAYICPDCNDYHLSKLGARHYNPTDVYATSVRGPVAL